jgi:hypothetical protein
VTGRDQLLAALEAAAAELPDIRATATAEGGSVWARARMPFAFRVGASVELRIGDTIAAAALRTPDVTTSARGSDWVAFAPPELDGHALDRLGAWFAAAHRRAVG